MPGEVHETMIAKLVRETERQLERIASPLHPHPPSQQPSSSSFAKEIKDERSTTITFEDPEYGRHDPDEQFRHSLAQYPSVVLEVSHSEKRKDLPRLADEYILGSDGNITMLIGVDIDYRGTKKSTLSIWQPQIIRNGDGEMELVAVQTVTDQILRHEDGRPNTCEDAGLHLQLQDFAPKSVVKEYKQPMNETIFIPAITLCSYLERAEEACARVKRREGVVDHMKNEFLKRKRPITPPEKLSASDKERFRNERKRVMDKLEKVDESWKGESSNDDR
ncbi:hypothetical protein DSL72_001459 [Monilinia vaccinii-corymbosi]|uniref:Uncharacterized protein n=1 Tax=Monilinia vaccinii-corymbosi TaxID=61207 RepID=A0A8A3P4W7_9HELO|nr:hypothetical protein DSL72_001459 [Monilinia vaccinii-corymbosi]